ncbi:cell wall hydrolase [Sphingosinicella humi]|uniref:Cell wall hydrolase n=1 Tax=Allosphingosinicella humi TaxID=2068657 RepID=A0A2U2J0K1_9SPHN|nr:cell wall hydrolase [Sphingosinicella humi]PWG01852.1 cell wall hydrolase [Sphingosinicella humi]
MINMLRAGGAAAAAFAFVATATFAGPSMATDVDAAPAVNPVADHANATIDAGRLAEASANSAEAVAAAAEMVQVAKAALPRPRGLEELVVAYAGAEPADEEEECLAGAVYFEARGESLLGQLAVAEVVLNRAASGKYPTTLCEVITQPWQFSFVNATGSIPAADRSSEAWSKAVAIARIATEKVAGKLDDDVLWYHADYVAPSWGKRLERADKIGTHIFYS